MTDTPGWVDDLESAFRRDGFLAEEMSGAVAFIKRGYELEFKYARRLNRLAQALYGAVAPMIHHRRIKDPICLGVQFMPRALSNFQGAAILLERGMLVEARTLIRSVFEVAFWILYLAKKPDDAVEHLMSRSLHSQRAVDGVALRYLNLDDDDRAQLKARHRMAKTKAGKVMEVQDIADASGYGEFYLHYSELSGGAAHGSLKSIGGYLAVDHEGTPSGHQIGPEYEQVGTVAKLSFQAMLLCIEGMRLLTDHTALDEEYKCLIEEFGVMSDGS